MPQAQQNPAYMVSTKYFGTWDLFTGPHIIIIINAYNNSLNNKVFANCTTICGLNQFWAAESGSEICFSLSHRVFD